jgi:hypothetical protein
LEEIMARPEKIAQVEAVEAAVNGARSIVLSDITGLNVAKVTELRRITAKTIDEEPKWRTPGRTLLTGYKGEWR